MRYLLAFNYFLMKPKTGWKNALCVGVCLLIPIVGQMVVLGYRSYVIEDLDDDPDKRYHRDFDMGKFSDYLTRGLWQALVQIGLQVVVVGLFYAMFLGIMLGGAAAKSPPAVMIGGMVVSFLFLMLASVASAMFVWPVEIYASLQREFEFGKAVAFARTFVAAVWRECLSTILAFTVLAMVLSMAVVGVAVVVGGGVGFALGAATDPAVGMVVGLLLYTGILLLGLLPFTAVLTMANGHLLAQLYVVYVDKGGVPLRDRDPFEPDPLLPKEDLD